MLDWQKIKEDGWKPKNGKEFKILSIDGGGIRGLFPAQYLARIEEETGKKINEYFDLIVGTSTGGIIALGLSIGIPAKEIANIYETQGKEIFKPMKAKRILSYIPMIGKKISKVTSLFKYSYTNETLKGILKIIFKDKKVRDADVMLCIPSLEHNKAKPKVYKTPHNEKFFLDGKLEMWKVALATSAAPTYFPPALEDGCKLDGGMWANNPVLVGITEALHHGIKSEDIKVLSIGTGENLYLGDDSIPKHGGLWHWGINLLDVFMNAQSYSAENIASYLVAPENLTRINFSSNNVTEKLGLDTVSDKCLSILKAEANTAFCNTFRNKEKVEEAFFY